MDDRYYWAALQIAVNLGCRSLYHLYRHFPSGRSVLEADIEDLKRVPNIRPQVVERIIQIRHKADPEQTAEKLDKSGIQVTILGDPNYPYALAQIADPPVILYTRGRLPKPTVPLLAVIGSRRATPYGKTITRRFAMDLVKLGWGIVSGMARGIDTAAHEGALDGGGYTMAVFGCGINICYPQENKKLQERIEAEGCVLSEFPPDSGPHPRNFPIRNRIISGCSLGTLVVEAGERSGALITAYKALEQGRDVFAIPGSLTSKYSKGTNRLIKQGAKLVECIEDIIEEYPYLSWEKPAPVRKGSDPTLTLEESCVLRNLGLEPIHIDQLVEKTGLSVSSVGSILTLLEFKGLAKQLPGNYYINPEIELESER
ncbi:MAG: DNA-processing protein DprA [Thermacetogeniaceae bacterium]